MVSKFSTLEGLRVNLIDYISERLHKYPDTKIYVGTDSQDYGRWTHYATVVAFRRSAKGVHFVYTKDKIQTGRDHWSRLWREVEMTVDLAEFIKESLPFLKIEHLEIDFNGTKNTLSNRLVKSARGWCEGMGYSVLVKPDEQVACKAADWLLK